MSELVRVSDVDRDAAVAALREHLVQGRLSLEEFTQRMSSAYAATTAAELATLQSDLPSGEFAVPQRRRSAMRFLVAIFGSTRRGGSIRVRENLVCLAIFGNVTLDLRGAMLEGDVVNVLAGTVFGSIDVLVPEGVEADLTGLAIFGSKATTGKPSTLRHGAPLVRVNALVVFGAATVKLIPANAGEDDE